ncbi:DsbA family protein [Methanoregula sp.]|uniref:DsbA family protein n=1 Tax=Methanoregula sp. TaxID=2052170 RepID=UPI00356B476C
MNNPWKIIAIVFILLFAATAVICISGVFFSDAASSSLLSRSAPDASGKAEIATNFIQTNLVESGTSVRLINVTEESGLFRLSLNVRSADNQEQILYVFISKDGKYLFPSTFMLNQFNPSAPSTTPAPAAASANACNAVTRAESPFLEAFVVSYCPYGQQMQKVVANVVSSIPTMSAHIKVRYLGAVSNGTVQSMHGPTEAAENLRQICIREEQPNRYWNYVSCFLNSTSSASCLNSTGIDTTKLSACTASPDRGISYAANDFRLANSYGATASPTLILNGATVSEFKFGGRNPEAVKSMICCSYTNQPEVCNTTLASSSAAATGTCG